MFFPLASPYDVRADEFLRQHFARTGEVQTTHTQAIWKLRR
ncbi:MAG TPA: hypothetical protein VMM60_14350 [Ilumatobacter sp.]|nr:hypothetical protein [Ilumatobacter sp.]